MILVQLSASAFQAGMLRGRSQIFEMSNVGVPKYLRYLGTHVLVICLCHHRRHSTFAKPPQALSIIDKRKSDRPVLEYASPLPASRKRLAQTKMSDSASMELLAAAKDAAARGADYYALLDLAPATALDDPITRDTVQSAWRKRSLKYHPDKAGENFDPKKWEEFGLARDILASDEARAAYDGARSAMQQKQRERDTMNAKQRRFAEELERAEGNSKKMQEEERERRVREEQERERQAAKGRAYMDERRRKMAEAEERERDRERRDDEQRDDTIRRLEEKLAEKAKRRAEKKAKRDARKSGVTVDEDVEMLSPRPAPPIPEPKPVEQKAAPIPAVDVQMSDDPVKFWDTQWPKTKARLLAAQATKERRIKETEAAA